MMSLGPPAGKGTISRICLMGKSSAPLGVARARDNPAINAPHGLIWLASAIEQFEGSLMDARIAGCDDPAAALRRLALPGRHDSARACNDRDQRGDVIRLELGLDDEVEMTGRKHAVGITVAAIARQPYGLFDTAEACPIGL